MELIAYDGREFLMIIEGVKVENKDVENRSCFTQSITNR